MFTVLSGWLRWLCHSWLGSITCGSVAWCYNGWSWLAVAWIKGSNSDIAHVPFILMGTFSWQGHRCRGESRNKKGVLKTSLRTRAITFSTFYWLKQVIRPIHKKARKTHSASLVRQTVNLHGKGCEHQRGSTEKKNWGIDRINLLNTYKQKAFRKLQFNITVPMINNKSWHYDP